GKLRAAGRAPPRELPVIKEVFCARDRATALEMAGPYLLAKYRDYATWGQDKGLPGHDDFRGSVDQLRRGRFVLGSPQEFYDQLKPYWEQLGVNPLIIRPHWAGMPLSSALAS